MGSRAIVVLCREASVSASRFGVSTGETGCHHIPARAEPSSTPANTTENVLGHLRAAADQANLWNELHSDWLLLDTGASAVVSQGRGAPRDPIRACRFFRQSRAPERHPGARPGSQERPRCRRARRSRAQPPGERRALHRRVPTAYAWPVHGVADLRIAPFHILAAESGVFIDREHTLASGHLRPARGRVTRLHPTNRPHPRRPRRRGFPETSVHMVGRAHGRRRRGHGREATRIHRDGRQRSDPTRPEMPWPRVPTDHLRTRIHRRRPDQSAENAKSRKEAIPGDPRVRTRR